MTPLDALTGLVIALGLVGIVVMVLPGTVLILGALLVWAVLVGETAGWVVFAVAATFLVVGQVVKYAVPGPPDEGRRCARLHAAGRGPARRRRASS